jgi:hypothetical protein
MADEEGRGAYKLPQHALMDSNDEHRCVPYCPPRLVGKSVLIYGPERPYGYTFPIVCFVGPG